MVQLSRPVEPFGEVNVYRQPDGRLEIIATILMVPDVDGACTGLALDASSSMTKVFGVSAIKSGPFAKFSTPPNLVEPVARKMASFLTRFSADGRVSLIYWALGPDGSQIEEIGRHTEAEVATLKIIGPTQHAWGRDTRLLPPVRYFVEQAFADAPWSIAVLVTDGVIADLHDVKRYCFDLANKIVEGKRAPVKLVLVGVGEEIDEAQMTELDDMLKDYDLRDPHGQPIDLWDHKLASEMKTLEEIFAEVVAEDTIIAASGQVLDPTGAVARDYPSGLPAYLRFTLPADADHFILEFPGGRVSQDIREGISKL